MMSGISAIDFIKKGYHKNIVDIRSVQKYNNNHIPGAKHVMMEELLLHPNQYLNKTETFYIYCQQGLKSGKLVKILNGLGYHTINIEGGYESWILEK